MSKYQPLESYLSKRHADEVPATFEEIEAIVGFKLPDTASKQRAWWSNNPSNNVMTKSWLAAGYQTERVDMAARKLVFRRARNGSPQSRPSTLSSSGDGNAAPAKREGAQGFVLERLWSTLGGTVHVPEGVDLTDPTGEIWDAEQA
jgi:hypothetical protein